MKIKQFIVTYNNKFQINSCLDSIFDNLSAEEMEVLDIFVINNNSNFELSNRFADKVTVLHNVLRPDFSTGHLARNWNQAILNGFKNLNTPAADILITNQDDTRFVKNYIDMVYSIHKLFDLAQFGWGDNFVSYTPSAVRQIGMWDERFCSIGYQEADYFLRALLHHRTKTTIQDFSHGRGLNILNKCPIEIIQSGNERGEIYHKNATQYHAHNKNLFIKKWGIDPHLPWTEETARAYPLIDSYILYPYFEKDILTLTQQRFLI
jgi:hypothetical protein